MPPDLTTLLDAAFTRHQAGDLVEASRLYHQILVHYPLQPDTLHMLGIIAKQQGKNELALKLIEVALGQNSSLALAWHNRALLLRMLGRKDEALQSVEQALDLDQNFADAWDTMGFLLRDKGDFERSRSCHARAVALQPDNLKYLGNFALLLLATGELAKAYAVMHQIEKKSPDFLLHTMGNILKAAGYTDLAIPYFQKSCRLLPKNDELRITEATARLQIGDFAEGWALWEQRPSLDPRFQNIPFWTGEPIDHLLVHEDQGMGDAFQCARFIPLLKPYARRITIQVTRAIRKPFDESFAGYEILTLDDPVPAANGRIRMLSLPAFFAVTADTIPTPIPYFKACREEQEAWEKRLISRPNPRIGLVWGGNPDHLNDRLRSITASQIEPLLQACGSHIISLQKGVQKSSVDLSAHGIFDADPHLHDFGDTAGLIAELDLLISVDTSVVHLAGAMGKPVWLMLPFDPDWRWLLEREDSPWYPDLRIFRQKEPRNWPEVVQRVTENLQRFTQGDASVLEPPAWKGGYAQRNPNSVDLGF